MKTTKNYLYLFATLLLLPVLIKAQQAEFYFNNNTKEEISSDPGLYNGAVFSFINDRYNIPNAALKLDNGNISYGDDQYSKFGTSDFSFSVWVKKGGGTQAKYFEKNSFVPSIGGYTLLYNGIQPRIDFNIWHNSNNYIVSTSGSGVDIMDSIWIHIVVTADRNDSMKMYVNNIFSSGTSIVNLQSTSLDIIGYDFTIGSPSVGTPDESIDDLRIYKKVLTEQEIKDLFEETPLTAPSLDKQIDLNSIVLPNPFATTSNIKINSESEMDNTELIIFDVHGKEVRRINTIEANGITVNRENLENGLYFYQIISGDKIRSNGKIIIQ